MIQRNPTLKTIQKIIQIFKQENQFISKTYIFKKYGIHPYSLNSAIDFLIKEEKLEPINSSNKGQLYGLKNGK